MDVHELIKQLTREQLERLAQAQTASALRDIVVDFGMELTDDASEEVFAALFPVRGKELSDEMLALITGGAAPKPTRFLSKSGGGIRL